MAKAFDLLTRAAQAGFGPAETRLGDYHLFGLAPGGEDVDAAIARYEAAAALGDAPGMTTLALMYRVGKGVPRDTARMVALLEEAAEAGYHFAQYRLAQTYLTGEGIPGRSDPALGIPDPGRAASLYTSAAEAGNITAALELAALYGDPASGVPENPREQARLTSMASRAGLPEATAALAVLYETGRGVEKSPVIAAGLYVKALESGKVSFDSLRRGASGPWDFDTAVAFQAILQERGLYPGPLDGVIGPGSAAGARALAGN
jgi:TPR repeat protein